MTRKPLSELHDWKLEHKDQDIRGWKLFDAAGANLGTIDELIVDTNTQYVEALRLKDGAEIPASQIEIGDRKVILNNSDSYAAHDKRTADDEHRHDQSETHLPVIDEEIDIGKRKVEQGGIRVTTHVHERPVEEQVTLRDETVHVDRRKVDRPATDADFERMRDQEFEVRETEEEAVVNKRARVTEEVHISKDVDEHRETVRGTERTTDVDVEKVRERDRKR
jgi:stress response protein YsnF